MDKAREDSVAARKRAEKVARGEGTGSEDMHMPLGPLESLTEAEVQEATGGKPKLTDYTQRRLDDPVVQRLFDQEALVTRIREVRQGLAGAKVNLLLAQDGLLEGTGAHPNQLRKVLADHRTALATLTIQYARLEASWEDEGFDWRPPGDSYLEVTSSLPARPHPAH